MKAPPTRDGPFGPIAEVDFPHPDGRPGGGRGYTLDVPGFRSSRAEESSPKDNAHLLRSGEELELWIRNLGVWRPCRFQWTGMGDPHLEVDVHDRNAVGMKVGETEKQLEPLDLFRTTTVGAEGAIPPDAKRAIKALRAAPGTSTKRLSDLLDLSIGRTRAALRYLREQGIANVGRGGHGNRTLHYTLTRKARQ